MVGNIDCDKSGNTDWYKDWYKGRNKDLGSRREQ
jgi:hypothetical protein